MPSQLANSASPPPAPLSSGQLTAPDTWRTQSVIGFEKLFDAWPPPGLQQAQPLAQADLAALRLALDEGGQIGVRAVVLLARSGDERVPQVLLARLEERVPAPGRADDAVDVVAAAAIAAWPSALQVPHAADEPAPPSTATRLAQLAFGPGAHPDLEVRVECARTALLGGQSEVIPFLLRVLRAETPTQHLSPPDWERVETLTWAKTRAAQALALHLGVKQTLRPDGSFAHIEEAVQGYERLLGLSSPGRALASDNSR